MNLTSLQIWTCIRCWNQMRYPLVSSSYPTSRPRSVFRSQFCLFSLGMCVYTSSPKTLRWLMSGCFLCHNSYGVTPFTVLGPVLFKTCTAIFTAFAHNLMFSLFACSSILAVLTTVRFSLSAAPFCSGLYVTVFSCLIPRLLVSSFTSRFTNSSPLSVLRVWTPCGRIFSHRFRKL